MKQRRQLRGAVLLDLHRGGEAYGPEYYLSYVSPGSKEARRYGIDGLIRSSLQGQYFAYIIVGPTGVAEVGIMSL